MDGCGKGESPTDRCTSDRHATPRFLTPGEVDRLLRRARGTVHRDIIYVLVRTGIRAAELAALRWEDVDLSGRVIRVGGRQLQPPRRQERQGHAARRRYLVPRAIPIDDELARIISRQPGGPDFKDPGYGVPRRTRRSLINRAARRPEFVFAAETGGPRRSIDRGIRRAAELAGIEAADRRDGMERGVGPRMLRHTFAAQLVMNGADTGVLRELLGLARAEHLGRYRSLVTDYRIPRGRPVRTGRPEDREHLDERKRRAVEEFRPRIGVPRELEEVERMIERLEDETRALASCRRTRRRLTAIVEDEKRIYGAGWLEILFEDGDESVEDAQLVKEARLVIDARLARRAELKEALARLDGFGRDLCYRSGRLVSDLGVAIRMLGRPILPGPVGPAGGLPEPSEVRRQTEELTEEVKHASCAHEPSAEGGDFTRHMRTRATGPPGRAGGIP